MRKDTIEAFCHLTSLFAKAIFSVGADLPMGVADQLLDDPRGACEELNACALQLGVIDDSLDRLLAVTYQGMDAEDARTEVDLEGRTQLALTLDRAYRARPVIVPEPVEEPEVVEVEEPAGEVVDTEVAEAETKPETAEPEAIAEPEPTTEPEHTKTPAMTEQPSDDVVPEAVDPEVAEASAEVAVVEEAPDEAASDAETAPESNEPQVEDLVANVEVEPEAKPIPEPEAVPEAEAAPAPSPEAGLGDTLSVDQAAAILGISKQEVYKLIKSGELPAQKQGRFWRLSASAVTARA